MSELHRIFRAAENPADSGGQVGFTVMKRSASAVLRIVEEFSTLWRANEHRNLAIDNRPERCRPPDDIDGMDKYQERDGGYFRL